MHQAALSRAVRAALLAPLLAPGASGQKQFELPAPRGYLPLASTGSPLAGGDVDGDGDLDLVLGAPERLYLNDGGGRFVDVTAARMPAFSSPTEHVLLGDVDGDGDLDIVLGTRLVNRLYVNDGEGTFTDATAGRLPAHLEPTFGTALADVDGDGDDDLIVANAIDSGGFAFANRLYLNDGAGTFVDATAGRLPVDTDWSFAVVAFDADRDGDVDIVFGNLFQNRLYVNDGTGVFADETAARVPAVMDSTWALEAGDVDADGDVDVVVGNNGQPDRLWLNDGAGTFTDVTAARMPPDLDDTRALRLGDVDGDGDPDLMAGTQRQDRLYLNEEGAFRNVTAERMAPFIDPTEAVVLGDVDGDADLDVVFGNGGQDRLLLNDGTGTFPEIAPACWPDLSDDTQAVALADVDTDGDLDVLVGNHIFGSQNRLYVNDGRGCFVDATAARMPAAANTTRALVAGDVDGDGDVDIVVGNGRGGYFPRGEQNELLLNDGTGTFVNATELRLPPRADATLALALGDLDGDGDLDLVVGNGVLGVYTSAGEPNALYLNGGNGVFTDATAERLPASSNVTAAVALGDVDGDGDLDLVTGESTPGYMTGSAQNRLYLNDGNAGFTDVTAERLPALADRTSALAFGDVDADGDLDLGVANIGQNRLLLNDGTGAFAEATAQRMPQASGYTNALALADVDEDGDLDIFADDALYVNDGTGRFDDVTAARVAGAGLGSITAVAVGDVDGDGDPDTVTGRTVGQVLRLNLHRQLSTPLVPVLSRSYELLFHAAPGYATSSHTAVGILGFGLWRTPVVLPPLGTSYVLPSFVLPPPVSIPAGARTGVYRLPIPPAPSLLGVELYTQGLLLNDARPGEARFTGFAVDAIRR